MLNMFRLCSYNKIFDSIVILNSINMVNNFFWPKISSEFILHYQAMFKNIKVWLTGIRMVSFKDKNISTSTTYAAALPSMAFFSKLRNGTMATIRTIFNVHSTCGEKSFAMRAFFFVINLFPRFMFLMPYSRSRVCPSSVFFNIRNIIIKSFHDLGIISGFNAWLVKI